LVIRLSHWRRGGLAGSQRMRLAINSWKNPARYWLHAVTGTFRQKLSTLQINSRWVWQTVCGEGCTLTAGGTIGAAAGGRISVGHIGVI
jgi:hypothetical protein